MRLLLYRHQEGAAIYNNKSQAQHRLQNEVYMVRSTIAISKNKEGRLSHIIAIGSYRYRILLSVLKDGKIFYSHVAMRVMCLTLSIFLVFACLMVFSLLFLRMLYVHQATKTAS